MKTFKSLLPEIQLRYKTTELKKVKIGCSEDGYKLLKQLYEEDTLEYLVPFRPLRSTFPKVILILTTHSSTLLPLRLRGQNFHVLLLIPFRADTGFILHLHNPTNAINHYFSNYKND